MQQQTWNNMSTKARALLAALVREGNPHDNLPLDDDAVYDACAGNWVDCWAEDAERAVRDAGALVQLRVQMGLRPLV